jgi:hypothetical protein
MRKRAFGIALGWLALVAPAEAGNLASTPSVFGTTTIVTLKGEIAEGDTDVLKRLIKAAKDRGRPVSTIWLNSSGGNLLEGVMLGRLIRYAKITTGVDEGATCASACFIIFAAGTSKLTHDGALVGVHVASERSGKETILSGAVTVSMARLVKEFGVPANIIGKMVVTPPHEMVWLTADELRSMGATMFRMPAPTSREQVARAQPPLEIRPTAQTEKLPSWTSLVDAVLLASARQNNGEPLYTRACFPETKTCSSGDNSDRGYGRQDPEAGTLYVQCTQRHS